MWILMFLIVLFPQEGHVSGQTKQSISSDFYQVTFMTPSIRFSKDSGDSELEYHREKKALFSKMADIIKPAIDKLVKAQTQPGLTFHKFRPNARTYTIDEIGTETIKCPCMFEHMSAAGALVIFSFKELPSQKDLKSLFKETDKIIRSAEKQAEKGEMSNEE